MKDMTFFFVERLCSSRRVNFDGMFWSYNQVHKQTMIIISMRAWVYEQAVEG